MGRRHHSETGKVGKKGVFTIPAALRKRFGLHNCPAMTRRRLSFS